MGIYSFGADGNAKNIGYLNGAMQGGLKVWVAVGEKYVPGGFSMLRPGSTWELAATEENGTVLTKAEWLTLMATFDNKLIRKEDFQEFFDAFVQFEKDTKMETLFSQVSRLIPSALPEDSQAIGFHITTVTESPWMDYIPSASEAEETEEDDDEEEGTYVPYNILTGTKHHWIDPKEYRKRE